MSALRVERLFGGVLIHGLFAQPGVLDVLVEICRDPDLGELLGQAADAQALVKGDADAQDLLLGKIRLDEALSELSRLLAARSVRLGGQDAIDLRNALHEARLGEGAADRWVSRRRSA